MTMPRRDPSSMFPSSFRAGTPRDPSAASPGPSGLSGVIFLSSVTCS